VIERRRGERAPHSGIPSTDRSRHRCEKSLQLQVQQQLEGALSSQCTRSDASHISANESLRKRLSATRFLSNLPPTTRPQPAAITKGYGGVKRRKMERLILPQRH
jgi:hypothetical protein